MRAGAVLVLVAGVAVTCVASSAASRLPDSVRAAPERPDLTLPRGLSFEERVAAQKAIEEVYWRHRIWPRENPTPKPALSSVMPDEKIRAKVEDYLRKSSALEQWWQKPITGAELQAELHRLSERTCDPEVLSELYAALGDDAPLIAETLARQTLVERLIRDGHEVERIPSSVEHIAEAGRFEIRAPSGSGCADDSWQRRFHSPAPLQGHTAVWTGTEMIVWGVLEGEYPTFWFSGGRYNPATDTWLPVSTGTSSPADRGEYTAVWTGTEMLVWGGESGTGHRYDPSTDTWTSISRGAGAPIAEGGHTAVWTGTEMIVWGGRAAGRDLNTGGRYDPATDTWIPTPTSLYVPDAREGHTAVWTGTEMIVWGGSAGPTGGRYDPVRGTWVRTSPSIWISFGRTFHSAVWTGTEMIIWGGQGGGSPELNTGARYNPVSDTWLPTSTGANVPEPRTFDHTAVWTGTEMIVWGGRDRTGRRWLNTGGRYDPLTDTWIATSTGTNVPTERTGHTAVWTGTDMIVWGGFPTSNTGGRYNPASDTWIPTFTSPVSRVGHTAVWTGAEMIVWGGGRVAPFSADSNAGARYSPSTDTWTAMSTGPNAPTWRSGHTAVWTGTEMIVWGGPDDTGGRYDPSTDTWIVTSTGANVPSGRSDHTAVWTGTEMIVWGGFDRETFDRSNTGGLYDPSTDTWTATSTGANVPEPRISHTAVWTGTEMIVWGGDNSSGVLDSGARYSPSTDTWTATSVGSNVPAARFDHTAVWTGTEMIVWGGEYADDWSWQLFDTGGRYAPSTDTWTPTSVGPNVPEPRIHHTAVWTGTEMIVWGGGGAGLLNTGGRYVPAADTWTPTSTGASSPEPRAGHTAVWTGKQMIVWGGGTVDASIGLYCVCTDPDHDEVCDGEDPFPLSDPNPTVVIDECDSGVANEWVSPGANMGDLIGQCRTSASSHGEFVSCVARLTNEWTAAGWITGREKSRIQSCTAIVDTHASPFGVRMVSERR